MNGNTKKLPLQTEIPSNGKIIIKPIIIKVN